MSQDQRSIQQDIVTLYEQKVISGFASEKITYEQAEELLTTLAQPYSRITLILDALDECHKETRIDLIETFGRLIKEVPKMKVLVSSRYDSDIKHQLEKEANLGIGATENEEDIRKFVVTTIAQDQQRRRIPISEELRAQIVQVLDDKSNGM